MNKTLSCRKVRAALEEAAGRPPTGPESGPLRNHLADCPGCRNFFEENRSVMEILQHDEGPDPGPEFWNRMTTRIMAEVRHRENQTVPWYKKPWANPFGWPAYAWSPVLILLIVAAFWFSYAPGTKPVRLAGNGPTSEAVSLEDGLDPLVDPVYTLTPRETTRLKQKIVARLAKDLRTDSPVEAVMDWDLSNRFDALTNDELEQVAKKLQTIGPTGTGEVLHNVS